MQKHQEKYPSKIGTENSQRKKDLPLSSKPSLMFAFLGILALLTSSNEEDFSQPFSILLEDFNKYWHGPQGTKNQNWFLTKVDENKNEILFCVTVILQDEGTHWHKSGHFWLLGYNKTKEKLFIIPDVEYKNISDEMPIAKHFFLPCSRESEYETIKDRLASYPTKLEDWSSRNYQDGKINDFHIDDPNFKSPKILDSWNLLLVKEVVKEITNYLAMRNL